MSSLLKDSDSVGLGGTSPTHSSILGLDLVVAAFGSGKTDAVDWKDIRGLVALE